MENTYIIIRFSKNNGQEIIKRGLTLEKAQFHCNNDNTAGEDWFDGYEAE